MNQHGIRIYLTWLYIIVTEEQLKNAVSSDVHIFHTLFKSDKLTVLFLQLICNILDSVDDCISKLVLCSLTSNEIIGDRITNKKHSQCTQTNNDSMCKFEMYKCMPCQETLELWENQITKRFVHATAFPQLYS